MSDKNGKLNLKERLPVNRAGVYPMLMARGKNIWTNLRNTFVNINRLFMFLKQENFTGYVHFISRDLQGLILLHEGDVVNGIEEINGERICGQTTVRHIMDSAQTQDDCRIFVAEFPTETVSILSEIFSLSVQLVHQKLSSEFTHLGKYVAKLMKAGFTGYLEIRFPNDRRMGMEFIQFQKGVIKAVVASEQQFRLTRGNKTDLKRVEAYIRESQKKGIHYSTFAVQ